MQCLQTRTMFIRNHKVNLIHPLDQVLSLDNNYF